MNSYGQYKADSIRTQRLREIEVLEKKRKLKADSISPVLRLEGRILETPQHIITVTSDLIKEQGGLVLKDMVRNASGVAMGYNSSVFDASAAVFMRGLPAPVFVNGMPQRSAMGALVDDAAIIDRMEFIKGPAGFLTSSGEPGGSMNIVTKTPGQRLLNAELSAGSFGLMRAAIDIGSKVPDKGLSYRFNGAYQYNQDVQDFIKQHKYVAAPVLQYNFSPNTYALAEYNLIRITSDGGSSVTRVGKEGEVLKDRIGNNYAGDPGLPRSYTEAQTARVMLVHRFNERWKLSVQGKYTLAPMEMWYLLSDNYSPVNFDSTNTTRRMPVFNSITGRIAAGQIFVNGTLGAGRRVTHKLLGGIDYNYSKDNFSNAYGKHSFYFNRLQPAYGLDTDSVRMLDKASIIVRENNWWSAFAYGTTHFGSKWVLNYGARYTLNLPVTTNPKQPQKQQQALSPRLGITWMADPNTALYALYDQSFIPQPGVDFSGQEFKPMRGNDIEAGVKREWWQRRLITTLVGYRIIKNNLLVTDLEHPGFRRQIGQVTSTGAELDIIGRITSRLSVSANYAYTHAVTSKDSNKDNEGNKLPFVPQQTVNTWLQYAIPVGRASRLRISAGHTSVIKRATYTPDFCVKDYTKFDAGLAFDAGKWYARVVADNITNVRYFSSADMLEGSIRPGERSYYYIEGNPVSFKAFVGVRL